MREIAVTAGNAATRATSGDCPGGGDTEDTAISSIFPIRSRRISYITVTLPEIYLIPEALLAAAWCWTAYRFNMGTILRTLDAFNPSGLLLLEAAPTRGA